MTWQGTRVRLAYHPTIPNKFALSFDGLIHTGHPRTLSIAWSKGLPDKQLPGGSWNIVFIPACPVDPTLPRLGRCGSYFRYIPHRYPHYYHRLFESFEAFIKAMKGSRRRKLNRFLRRFRQQFGEDFSWKLYQSETEIEAWYTLACRISRRTYQAQWLELGLPESPHYLANLKQLAQTRRVRACLLFIKEKPISYLVCPITQEGILVMQYGGADPDYRRWSPSYVSDYYFFQSVYQNKADLVELIDLSEGEGEHKRLFSTETVNAADIYYFKGSPYLIGAVLAHWTAQTVYRWGRDLLSQYDLDKYVRHWLRGQ